jgi:hypothetical protein
MTLGEMELESICLLEMLLHFVFWRAVSLCSLYENMLSARKWIFYPMEVSEALLSGVQSLSGREIRFSFS